MKYLSYVMEGQVVVPALLNVRIGESDAGVESNSASDVDARLVGE